MHAANLETALTTMDGMEQPDGAKLIVRPKTQPGQKVDANSTSDNPGRADSDGKIPRGVGMSPPPGVDVQMFERLQFKLAEGKRSSYALSQWYIIQHLGHITDTDEMK